jgi:hypothetical protein
VHPSAWVRAPFLAVLLLFALVTGSSLAAPPPTPGTDDSPSAGHEDQADGEGEAGSEGLDRRDPQATRGGATPRGNPEEESAAIARLDARSQEIEALIAGELDAAVDVDALFELDLSDPLLTGDGGLRLRSLIARHTSRNDSIAHRGSKRQQKVSRPRPRGPSADLAHATDRLFAAYDEFLALDPTRRRSLLVEHRSKHGAHAEAERVSEELRRERLKALRARADALRAFMDGTLAVEVDPRPLLALDLIDEQEPALSSTRRQSWSPPRATTGPAERLEFELAQAELELDAARQRFLSLDSEQRDALFAIHARDRADPAKDNAAPTEIDAPPPIPEGVEGAELEAAKAARAREEALAAAKEARSTSLRVLAEERARLLAIKQSMALYEAELARTRARLEERNERTLELRRRVGAFDLAIEALEPPPEDADQLYGELGDRLTEARKAFAEELGRSTGQESAVPAPGKRLEELGADVKRAEVDALHSELVARAEEITLLEQQSRNSVVDSRRDEVASLNRARLQLLEHTSSELHSEVTGFGTQGIHQLEEELAIISLELRYTIQAFERHRSFQGGLTGAVVPVLLGLLQLIAIVLFFRIWRKRADDLLKAIQNNLARREAPTRLSHSSSVGVWYFAQVRKPLEWLLVFGLLFNWVLGFDKVPELRLIWLVVSWFFWGLVFIRLANAMAARGRRSRKRRAGLPELRIRSLRLVGLSIVVIGLLLSLTAEVVGQGTIYGWVWSTCWVLAAPIVLLLVAWWRPIIFDRLRLDPDDSPVASRVLAREKGVWSFPFAVIGGAYLFARGISRWVLARASSLDATRRIMAYLFRREVARQAEAEIHPESQHPISIDHKQRFFPTHPEELLSDIAREELGIAQEITERSGSRLVALIGERGSGKSTFLARLVSELEDVEVLHVECVHGGSDDLFQSIARALGLPGNASLDALAKRLGERGPTAILIDDAQRIVRPTIGGLAEIDRLTAFARHADAQVTWIVAMGAASWQFVNRARGDRVFFDRVIELPSWSEEQIGELLQSRCSALGVDPSFEGLSVPRRFDETPGDEGERTRKGFYRILWDYSDGNPAVALHFWGESLRETDDHRLIVRLFQEPGSARLDTLNPSILFILRALTQLERATTEDLARCTQISVSDAEEVLRFAVSQGFVEHQDGRYQVVRHWYRAVTNMLRRQHLLAV